MTRLVLLAAAIMIAAGCGGVSSPPGADATGSDIDGSGGGVVDGAPGTIDVAVVTVDAAAPDGDTMCMGVGDSCTGSCPAGLICHSSGAGGFCAPDRPGCGGFAGATCDDPNAPICMYLTGADFGICVDDAERECVCNGAPGAVQGC